MAKTRENFVQEGQRAARMGNTKGVMPEFGKGPSWQAKAFAEGFNCYMSESVKAEPDREPNHEPDAYIEMPQATQAHISNLRRQLANTNGMPAKRRVRLVAKITTLMDRYTRV